jgi:hypothetical protein
VFGFWLGARARLRTWNKIFLAARGGGARARTPAPRTKIKLTTFL